MFRTRHKCISGESQHGLRRFKQILKVISLEVDQVVTDKTWPGDVRDDRYLNWLAYLYISHIYRSKGLYTIIHRTKGFMRISQKMCDYCPGTY